MPLTSWPSPARSPALEDDGGDRYLRLCELAHYSALSVRTLKRLIARPADPLPAHRVGRITIVRRSTFDAWLARQTDQADQVQQSLLDVTDADMRIAMALRGYAVKGGRR